MNLNGTIMKSMTLTEFNTWAQGALATAKEKKDADLAKLVKWNAEQVKKAVPADKANDTAFVVTVVVPGEEATTAKGAAVDMSALAGAALAEIEATGKGTTPPATPAATTAATPPVTPPVVPAAPATTAKDTSPATTDPKVEALAIPAHVAKGADGWPTMDLAAGLEPKRNGGLVANGR